MFHANGSTMGETDMLSGHELQEKKKDLKKKKRASNVNDFNDMRKWFRKRVNILAEGDSWFAYPPKGIIAGAESNLIAHISGWTKGKANFYCMASSGDEAVDMVSGKQKHKLVEILRWHTSRKKRDPDDPLRYARVKGRDPIDLLLFSGGGNDVVGENDFERFLKKPSKSNPTPADCVQQARLKRKTEQIGLAFEELLDIRDHYSPDTVVLTHTYGYPYPSDTGAQFLAGLIKTKAWMKRFMDANGIKKELQAGVIKIFMDHLGDSLLGIAKKRKKFIVVDTRGTLKGEEMWLNEIHPTSEGFEILAECIHKRMTKRFPALK